jgi:phosphoribosylamine--glycine ligase
MIKVLLIGNGAREHTLAEAIVHSPQNPKLFSYTNAKNPGILKLSESFEVGGYDDLERIRKFAEKTKPDFCVIGPEAPLDFGVVDTLNRIGIPSVGPTKDLAKLETSKSFTRLLMEKHNIPGLPKFRVFSEINGIKEFIQSIGSFVVKPDGLTGGKGVKVHGEHLSDEKEAIEYCKDVLKKHPSVIIEERLEGEEFSLQSFTDGEHILDTPPAQDHKRAFENDQGPNTGGMGSYSCSNHLLPFLSKEDIEEAHRITELVAKAIRKETGEAYKGVMYGGFILTRDGVKLLEYNARLGDPEIMNVLPILRTDFIEICYGVIHSNLSKVKAEFERVSTVCKYAAPKGYPTNPIKNEKIEIPPETRAKIYFASVDQREDGLYMTGSRAVAFVGISEDFSEAEKISEEAISKVKGPIFYRKDIGTEKLIQKRIEHMKRIREHF